MGTAGRHTCLGDSAVNESQLGRLDLEPRSKLMDSIRAHQHTRLQPPRVPESCLSPDNLAYMYLVEGRLTRVHFLPARPTYL